MIRSFRPILLGLLLGMALPGPLLAQRADLPPPELVATALDNHPTVLAATARLSAARAQADMLRAGPHEVTVTGSYLRRTVDVEGGYNEFDTTVSKPLRLPGKASLDRKAGAFGIDAAQNRMEDARHQTSLMLAGLWYDWLTAEALARTNAESVAGLERAMTAVKRRVELRDASPLDADQAASALALVKGQLADAQALAAAARVTLAATFPDLPLPLAAPALTEPQVSVQGFETLRDLVIERSHEIGAARAEADRQSVLARRAKADRVADPSLGVRLFSERGGMEKGAGIVASIPIGGRYRARAADEADAVARSAALEMSVVQREVEATANADLSNAKMRLAVWREVAEAGKRAQAVTERTARGYTLGAIDLADLLYAERQAQDTRRAEINARSEALRAILKLEIDSHVTWAPLGETD